MTPDLQQEVYSAVYILCMAALNPTYAPGPDPDNPAIPTIPIIQDQQDQNAPTAGVFIAVQGSPSLDPQGTVQRTIQDGTGERGLIQVYAGECMLREVHGNGSALVRIRDFSETEAVQSLLEPLSFSVLEFGPVQEGSFNLEHRWIMQAFMSVRFTIASVTHETLSTIESVEYTGP